MVFIRKLFMHACEVCCVIPDRSCVIDLTAKRRGIIHIGIVFYVVIISIKPRQFRFHFSERNFYIRTPRHISQQEMHLNFVN